MAIIYYFRKVFSCFKRKYIGYVLISVKSYCAEKYLPIIIFLAFSRIEGVYIAFFYENEFVISSYNGFTVFYIVLFLFLI